MPTLEPTTTQLLARLKERVAKCDEYSRVTHPSGKRKRLIAYEDVLSLIEEVGKEGV